MDTGCIYLKERVMTEISLQQAINYLIELREVEKMIEVNQGLKEPFRCSWSFFHGFSFAIYFIFGEAKITFSD